MTEKKTVMLSEILSDFKHGSSDEQLKAKYGLTQEELDYTLDQMVANKQLDQSELQAHRALEAGLLEIPENLPTHFRKKAIWGIIIGILVAGVGAAVGAIDPKLAIVSPLGLLLGTVVFTWGCCYLAKSKGYHGALGLLGLLGCFGLLILLIIPNRFKGSGSAVWVAVAIVAGVVVLFFITGIILAIAVPYYVSMKRTASDRAAYADVLKLGAAVERLGAETLDANGNWNTLCKKIDNTNIKWLLGPHYGFSGTNKKADVRIYIDTENNEIRGFALKGSRPAGLQSRYVYRISLCSTKKLPTERSTEDFSKYIPISSDKCYTTTMITGSGQQVNYIEPKSSVPCTELRNKE